MHFQINIFIFLNIFFNCVSGTEVDDVLQRNRRQLLFPNSTLLQFNAGVGTPSPTKNVNVNWAFQANFQLPWNRTQIPTDILNVYAGYDGTTRKKRESGSYENDSKLFHFYKYVEDVLNRQALYILDHIDTFHEIMFKCLFHDERSWATSFQPLPQSLKIFGHDGHSCVKQALCQIGAQPLHSEDEEDLLHELASFVLNPRNDVDIDSHVTEQHDSFPYILAHRQGQNSLNCVQLYESCKFSLVDVFSKLN